MRIDNPISNNAIITGSFTGSFKGDGTNLTGVTAEWDGSHVGDANITGSLTVAGNILPAAANTYDLGSATQYFKSAYISAATINLVNTSTGTIEKSLSADSVVTQEELASSLPSGVVSGSVQVDITGTTGYSTLNDAVVLNTAKISFDAASSLKLDGIEAGATGDQTAAEIKTAYESNADTNAFDDAAVSKLAGIEAGATGDQSAAEIRAAVEAATDSNVFTDADHTKLNGIEAGATNDTAALSSLDSRVTDVEGDVSAILLGSQADKDSFAEIVTLINSVDTTNDSALGAHVANTSNPHSVTKAQVGLGNVDNTSDADKPISTATQTALNAKQAAGTYNTIIGTDTDLDTSGAEVVDQINVTDGVIQSMSKRTMTLANLGYTGATNANYITNNNELTNGAGYITSYVNTTYTAGAGLTLTGTVFSNDITNNNQLTNGAGYTTYTSNQATNTTSAVNFASVVASGNITAYSDARLKKDVKTIEGALDKTKELRGVEFTRIADDAKSIGVIAQELEAVLPELVMTDDEGMKSVNYAQITGLLIEAVKELSAKVDELSK